MPKNTPVWVNEDECKACSKCVAVCPAGVLAMKYDYTSTLGQVACVIEPNSCLGCAECELACPDFAIIVADKKDFKFAKLNDEAKQRAIKLKENDYKLLDTKD
ncbi:MAG: 4Fe-4S binding protein [Sphaerochaetaceae bacterium]|nr:4Fe-4S binding protein [Sphaerochaetaceae bacterium]